LRDPVVDDLDPPGSQLFLPGQNSSRGHDPAGELAKHFVHRVRVTRMEE
jgi:hypothetical protein